MKEDVFLSLSYFADHDFHLHLFSSQCHDFIFRYGCIELHCATFSSSIHLLIDT